MSVELGCSDTTFLNLIGCRGPEDLGYSRGAPSNTNVLKDSNKLLVTLSVDLCQLNGACDAGTPGVSLCVCVCVSTMKLRLVTYNTCSGQCSEKKKQKEK